MTVQLVMKHVPVLALWMQAFRLLGEIFALQVGVQPPLLHSVCFSAALSFLS